MSPARHVIFGTGAIGLATHDALRRRGEHVRLVPPRLGVVDRGGFRAVVAAPTRASAAVRVSVGWVSVSMSMMGVLAVWSCCRPGPVAYLGQVFGGALAWWPRRITRYG